MRSPLRPLHLCGRKSELRRRRRLLADEPDHDGLCEREQAYFLKAIREGIDLNDHWAAARDSLAIVLAAEQSIRTGQVVAL